MKRSSLLWIIILVAAIAGSCNNSTVRAADAIGNLKDTVNPGKSDSIIAVTDPVSPTIR